MTWTTRQSDERYIVLPYLIANRHNNSNNIVFIWSLLAVIAQANRLIVVVVVVVSQSVFCLVS